jgi:hypothetical protein
MRKMPFPFSQDRPLVDQEAGVWLSLPGGALLANSRLIGKCDPGKLLLAQLTVRRVGWSRDLVTPDMPRAFPRDWGLPLEFPDMRADDPLLLSTENDRIWVAARARRDDGGKDVIPFYLTLICEVQGT